MVRDGRAGAPPTRTSLAGNVLEAYPAHVIIPMSMEEIDTATDEEIIAAYLEVGVGETAAHAYLAVLRNPDPRFVVD